MTRAATYAHEPIRARPGVLAALCGMLSAVAPAAAGPADVPEPIIDREQRFSLTLDQGWSKRATDQADTTPLLGYEHTRWTASLAVSRTDYPNMGAWRKATREAYFDDVEHGLSEHVSQYQRLWRKTSTLDTVPTLDLVFRRTGEHGQDVLFMRFLCFRRYTLTLAVSLPERDYKRHRRALERVLRSFKPHLQ